MARYVSPESRAKKKKQQKRRRLAMYLVMAVFVLAAAFGIVKIAERFIRSPGDEGDKMMQHTNTDVTMQRESYNNFEGTVQPTINLEPATPEMTMIQVPENDKVDISYFSDAVFMGDSLADGFRVYAGPLGLSDTGAHYLTAKSLSPRSFTQPGAMINFGTGPIDPWAVLEQVNPKKVYVTLGTNALVSMEPQDFIDSYYVMIDMIKQKAPNAVIYVTTITPTAATIQAARPNLSIARIYAANQLIARMCNEKGLGLINLYDVFKSASGYLREDVAYSDGIHLTPAGYGEWLDYLISHTIYNPSNPYI